MMKILRTMWYVLHVKLFFFSSTAFRLVPYPLEKGHLFHPYPACTENADRELLPSKFCI